MIARALRSLLLLVACACLLSQPAQPAQADVTRTGTLQATVFDDFRGGDSVTRYTLRSGGRATAVRPTELDAEPGDRVAVTGEMRDGRLVAAVEATGSGAEAQAVVPGPRKTAVILVSFPGGSGEPWSPEATRSEVFTAADSVSAFYEGQSYGEISLTGKLNPNGDVFGWYGLDVPTAGCPYNTWKSEADKAATAAGVDLSGYQHLIYEFPHQSSCSWLGTAAAGGSWSMINGNLLGYRAQVTAHELGHNLGLWHAGSWTCHAGGARVQISDNCTASEYGDPFDVMGNIAFRHNNGWSLAKLGILTTENVETVEASGTYSIESALEPTAERTVLRIPRARALNGNITSWYYFHDAPLAAGGLFDGGPVQVSTLSAGGGSATVSVELDETPPTAPAGLTATAGFEQVQLQWEPSADDHGVHRYIVFRDGSEVGGIGGGTSFVDSLAPVGDYTYLVHAEDFAGNRSAASEPATASVPAISGPVCASGTCRLTYRHTGASASWIVPPGVGDEAEFTVEGGRGGSESPASLFGAGGRVVATLGSLAGEEVALSVGGAGEPRAEGGSGGFNGGGDGALGGGGGGFSSVELDSTLILLAAGGGGQGSKGFNSVTEAQPAGGRGGWGGERGTPGASGAATQAQGVTLNGGGGGESGGFGAGGGAGGDPSGVGSCPSGVFAGAPGAGGDEFSGGGGTSDAGGGGGGGYIGGGQGGAGASDACGSTAGAGGGGGGSSFAAPGLSAKFLSGVRRGDGQISIAYANPVVEPPPGPEPPEEGDGGGEEGGRGDDAGGDDGGLRPVPIFEAPLPVPPAAIAIAARRAWVVRGTGRVKLACRGGAPGSVCRGVLQLSTAGRPARRGSRSASDAHDRRRLAARRTVLGRTHYALGSGRARAVAVRLRATALRRLRRAGLRVLRVQATVTAAGGQSAQRAIALRLVPATLRPARQRR